VLLSSLRSPPHPPSFRPAPRRGGPVVRAVREEVLDEVDALGADVRNQLGDARALLGRKVKVHVGALLELGKHLGRRRSQDGVNFVDLV